MGGCSLYASNSSQLVNCTNRERILAEDHPNRLISQHTLAGAYQANGQVKEAVDLLQQVVAIRERTLIEDHPDRLASQNLLRQISHVMIKG